MNQLVFTALNAPADPPIWLVTLVDLLANSPIIVAPAVLLALWIWGRPNAWTGLLAAAGGVFAGQGINLVVGLVIDDPRPFMVPVGHTLIAHAADNGFPSDHATLVWTLGLTLLLTRAAPRWGIAMLVYGLAVAWSRIWLGIHFPVDMLGSALVALVVGLLACLIQPRIRQYLLPIATVLYEGAVCLILRRQRTEHQEERPRSRFHRQHG